MIKYDPAKPLISLHIPKCGGQSVRRVLKNRFGDNFYLHYFQKRNAMPEKYELEPGICIHGHFNKTKGFGVDDYYPGVEQIITFLRDPLEIVISNYFFWKRTARKRQIDLGYLKEGSKHDYRDIEDFFEKRPASHIPDFLPGNITLYNFKEVFEKRFVYTGIVEDMKTSLAIMGQKLGFECSEDVWINKSERNEKISPKTKERFIENNSLAYEIYNYAKKNHKSLLHE
jgi:hypothetical protein